MSLNIQRNFSAFLWKAEKNAKVAYFFGTMHIPSLSVSHFPEEILKYIESSQIFFVEADLSNEILPFSLSKNQTLDKTLSQASWDKINNFYRWQLSHQSMDKQQIEKFLAQMLEKAKLTKPFDIFVEIEILALAASMKIYFNIDDHFFLESLINQNTLDTNLLEYIRKIPGLRIAFLEDAETQLSVLHESHPVNDFDYLIDQYSTLKDLVKERTKRIYGQMICYEKADLDCMKKELSIGQNSLVKSWQEIAVVKRNKMWISVIEKSLESGHSFIAAGISHFIGKDSILELLQEKNFKIKRIQF